MGKPFILLLVFYFKLFCLAISKANIVVAEAADREARKSLP